MDKINKITTKVNTEDNRVVLSNTIRKVTDEIGHGYWTVSGKGLNESGYDVVEYDYEVDGVSQVTIIVKFSEGYRERHGW